MKYFILLFACFALGCYNQKKAQTQFGKAAANYPIIPATYCAITYPPKVEFVKGDTITNTDTLQLDGNVITDTVVNLDTVRITTIKTLPGQTITKVIHVTDTVKTESTAKLSECDLERNKTLDLLADSNTKLTSYEGKAKKRGIIMWSLIALIVVYSGWKIYNIFKPKIKT